MYVQFYIYMYTFLNTLSIPLSLYIHIYIYIYSTVLSDFDLAQRHEDHQLVTLQLQWVARHHLRKPQV